MIALLTVIGDRGQGTARKRNAVRTVGESWIASLATRHLALVLVGVQSDGLGESSLAIIESPKTVCLEFQRASYMQTVERSNAKFRSVATPQFGRDMKRALGNAGRNPHTSGLVSIQLFLDRTCFHEGQQLPKNMLPQGMGPFRLVKRREPKVGSGRDTPPRIGRMRIG